MARIPAPRDVSGGGGGVHITTRSHIASDMRPGKGSRIPRDMGPRYHIASDMVPGGSTKGGGGISLLYRCHSGFVPARKCSGGTYLLADLFPRNISASVDVPPGTFPHTQKCSGQRKCSASA